MLKVLELFAGIGACSKALERLGIEHEIVDAVEIDKYAIKSFNAVHNTNFEPQDITKWDKDIKVDLIMHGSPCQDFSLAGKQAGGDKDSGTRSSLMYETIRIVKKLNPKYVIWENVKNLLSKKHKHNFEAYLQTMEQLGYTNYYQVLNAKDYGIPQNRERVFVVSVLCWSTFEFPKKRELKLKLKDMLEDKVDEKYYLAIEKYAPALSTMQGGDRQPKIAINKIDIPQTVRVRKYPVNIEKLKATLRQHKIYTNKEISTMLQVPLTTVEHWFRNDSCFSIPDAEIWHHLKDLLQIKTNEFDKSITEFEERAGTYEKSERCYLDNGLAPTITSASANEKIIQWG